ncbi:MAG: Do family serine endopeptidase, partial [Nitrospirota bacterium]|nr:Do family serine endopeptidase [Nitrospirota bacterium]
ASLCALVPRVGAQDVPQSRTQIVLSFAPVVRAAAPAVVNVYTRKEVEQSPLEPFFSDPFFERFFQDFGQRLAPQRQPQHSLGSGVIVRDDGLIVTNNHVVEDADEIVVVLADRREFDAEILGADAAADLALLRIETKGEHMPTLPFGDSDGLQVGDLVLAIGNPFGIGQTVTSGIVSALARVNPEIGADLSFIQTDAAINPGNSGGALVTVDGQLVGINTAIFTRSGGSIGIGFAIPINLVKALIRSVEGGDKRLARAWLGARVQTIDADLAATLGLPRPVGVLVTQVYPGGPSERAGLTQGDVLMSVDGREVSTSRQLNFRLALSPLGGTAELQMRRRGDTLRLTLPLERPPRRPEPQVTTLAGAHVLRGATVANLSPRFNEDLGIDLFRRGVMVVRVDRRSPAARLRLEQGDVIAAIAGEPIDSVDQLETMLASKRPPWRLEVDRGDRRLSVTIGG